MVTVEPEPKPDSKPKLLGEEDCSIANVPVTSGSKLSGCGPAPLVLPTKPPAPTPAPPAPAVVPPAPAPLIPDPTPPWPPPGVLETTPESTPRKEPPALVRRISVSAIGRLKRATDISTVSARAIEIASF